MTNEGLGRLLVERALLEGDFVLRSGKRSTWYLDKYRFETEPEVLRAVGDSLAQAVREFEPGAVRLAGPCPRRRRVGSFGIADVRLAVHHRAR